MKNNINYFHIVLSEKAKQLGFKRNKNKYIRVINDVYQCFEIERLPYKRIRINFGVLPMCMPSDHYDMLRYDLTQFLPMCDFKYYEDEESVCKCAENVFAYACKFMFPIFEKATTSTSALSELLQIDKQIEQIRIKELNDNNISDGACAFELRTIPVPEKYYYALKIKNYEFVKYCFSLSIENYNYLIDRHSDKKEYFLNKISMCNDYIQRINSNSFDVTQQLMAYETENFRNFNKYLAKTDGGPVS